MRATPPRSDAALFWLAWAYGAGLAGSLAFTGVVLFAASEPLFPEDTSPILFTWVFLGILVFLAFAFVLSLLGVPQGVTRVVRWRLHPRDEEFLDAMRSLGLGVPVGKESVAGTRRMTRSLRRALGGVVPLAVVLLLLSLVSIVGLPPSLPSGLHVENARAVFGLLGLFVLLVPGMAYVYLAAHRSRTATAADAEGAPRKGTGGRV